MRPGVVPVLACCVVLMATAVPAVARIGRQPFAGDRLAYVSGGKLYVGLPHARLIAGPGIASRPAFSYDGQWLAFVRQGGSGAGASWRLWLARADGSFAHAVALTGGASVGEFQWSPSADVLAVQSTATRGVPPPIVLIGANGTPRTLPGRLSGSFLWSPHGRHLAVATSSPGQSTRLDIITGTRVRSYALPGAGPNDGVQLAGWWPDGHGVLYWVDPMHSASIAADGMELRGLDLRSGAARKLGVTLGYRDWITVGRNRLLVVKGADRSAFFGKHLQLCPAMGACRTLAGGDARHISLDPAVSPGGGAIAYVVAPAWKTMGWRSAKAYRAWMNGHVLSSADSDGANARPVGGVPAGVENPLWTRDGRGLLFVKDGALWFVVHLGASNAIRGAQLVPAGSLPDPQKPAYAGWYYGHMDWHDLFAWY